MSKQTFTAGNVLTAAEMNTLQTNDFNQTVSTKTASYVLVADDKGTRVVMNSGSATTITVNNSVFEAGDSLRIQNIGSGACTITAGTATVATTGKLELAQYGGGELYFTSASSAIFFPFGGAATMIKKVDRFTTSGSWTVPAGVTYAVAHMLGGGGSGGNQTTAGNNGGTSSVAFASGTVSALGGKGGVRTDTATNRVKGNEVANSGRGGGSNDDNSGGHNNVGSDAQWIVAGAAVTPAASITVTVGAGGTAPSGASNGGSGYVWIEYYEEA